MVMYFIKECIFISPSGDKYRPSLPRFMSPARDIYRASPAPSAKRTVEREIPLEGKFEGALIFLHFLPIWYSSLLCDFMLLFVWSCSLLCECMLLFIWSFSLLCDCMLLFVWSSSTMVLRLFWTAFFLSASSVSSSLDNFNSHGWPVFHMPLSVSSPPPWSFQHPQGPVPPTLGSFAVGLLVWYVIALPTFCLIHNQFVGFVCHGTFFCLSASQRKVVDNNINIPNISEQDKNNNFNCTSNSNMKYSTWNAETEFCTCNLELGPMGQISKYFENPNTVEAFYTFSTDKIPSMVIDKPATLDVRPNSVKLSWMPAPTAMLPENARKISYTIEARQLPSNQWVRWERSSKFAGVRYVLFQSFACFKYRFFCSCFIPHILQLNQIILYLVSVISFVTIIH